MRKIVSFFTVVSQRTDGDLYVSTLDNTKSILGVDYGTFSRLVQTTTGILFNINESDNPVVNT